jgi:hypothetical protein
MTACRRENETPKSSIYSPTRFRYSRSVLRLRLRSNETFPLISGVIAKGAARIPDPRFGGRSSSAGAISTSQSFNEFAC